MMDLDDQIEWLADYLDLQNALWTQFTSSFSADLDSSPKTGSFEVEGKPWTFRRHGYGVLFVDEQGHRKVDLHDGASGVDRVDSWRLATYLGSLGKTGDKFLKRAICLSGGALEDRVKSWLSSLVAKHVLQSDGATFCLVRHSNGR